MTEHRAVSIPGHQPGNPAIDYDFSRLDGLAGPVGAIRCSGLDRWAADC
ncbi:hypothetical protein [Streptomyces stelliscabiei]|nr:hypothetical protein [Streptomyces stelliscabiei]MDX2661027.1 hypothetical protein [Streptomyces stelliscabiei]MDX2715894.1 hypothetical protein [Streptomyces stelliscabiei]MDX2790004.1 hypothetical protein [Streptomyces stelliscabiei]